MFKNNLISVLSVISALMMSCGSDDGPKRLVLGTGNEMYEDNLVQYSLPLVVQVTRDDERAAANVSVEIKVRPTHYYKGEWFKDDSDGDTIPDRWNVAVYATCVAEDINNDSYLDPAEDINTNGTLEPTYAVTINAHPDLIPTLNPVTGRIVTDATGFGYFVITYPKSEGKWSRVLISATAKVDGTEEQETFAVTLPVLVDDISDLTIAPPGNFNTVPPLDGPYGAAGVCINPL